MSEIYEDSKILDEYLLFHYGKAEEILQAGVSWPEGMREALDFCRRTPAHFSQSPVSRGLDLGCAVGGSAFEMSRHCDEVWGLDFSHAFIAAANALKNEGQLDYKRLDEGNSIVRLRASLPDRVLPERTTFLQGDAMNLPQDIGRFERVHAANLLCRLSDPLRLIERFGDLVAEGGELVLATPCTWLEDYTPRENWPSGDTLNWLKYHLSEAFELRDEIDEPFLIRETARKFQWTRSMVTVWRRL